jgi:glycosyltransferase involved in cell wall biosynthesis
VSVIIPVLNGERFLPQAIESVLGQDYKPLELIIVDDGSQDASGEIARSFGAVRYERQGNQGPAAARNRGIEVSGGEFIAFLDHDDVMPTHKVSLQAQYLLSHPEVDCVLGRAEVFFEPGVERPPWLRPDLVFNHPGGTHVASAMARRQVFTTAGGFDRRFRDGEDLEWLYRLRQSGVEIAFIPDVVVRRRIHTANMTHGIDVGHAMLRAVQAQVARRRTSTGEIGGE